MKWWRMLNIPGKKYSWKIKFPFSYINARRHFSIWILLFSSHVSIPSPLRRLLKRRMSFNTFCLEWRIKRIFIWFIFVIFHERCFSNLSDENFTLRLHRTGNFMIYSSQPTKFWLITTGSFPNFTREMKIIF
jgi:hypothetical protein